MTLILKQRTLITGVRGKVEVETSGAWAGVLNSTLLFSRNSASVIASTVFNSRRAMSSFFILSAIGKSIATPAEVCSTSSKKKKNEEKNGRL